MSSRENYGKPYKQARWFPSTGKIIPFDPSTGKLVPSQKLKCETQTRDSDREWAKQLEDAKQEKRVPAQRKGKFGPAFDFFERIIEAFL